MNPVITLKNNVIAYYLDAKDKHTLSKLKLITGAGSDIDALNHQVCIMQAVSMITSQSDVSPRENSHSITYSDHPICVSNVLAEAMIQANDGNITEKERQSLKRLIPDILNTAPVVQGKTKEYRGFKKDFPTWAEAERQRLEILDPYIMSEDITSDDLPKFRKDIRKAAALYKTEV